MSEFINAVLNRNTTYTPIWLMRQAGRYLPEYCQLRQKAGSFLKLCQNPEYATTVTLQPLQRFALDAAILFSDILVVPNALGMELNFIENEGPKFTSPLYLESKLDALDLDAMLANLNYVFATIKEVKHRLPQNIPLIGFSGSPFTLACYMLEGGSSSNYLKVKSYLYNQPELLKKLLDLLAVAVTNYLQEQIKSGVDTVMLFDSWGGVLTSSAYQEFSLTYITKIITNLSPFAKIIVFTKGGGLWMDALTKSGAQVIGLDWHTDIAKVRNQYKNVALQGNLDPGFLAVADKSSLKKEVMKILDSYKAANNGRITGHIFNLGHGILPITPPDNVAYLIDLVHELSQS